MINAERFPSRFPVLHDGHGFMEGKRNEDLQGDPMATTPLKQLGEHGQSVWIDFLSRNFIHGGDLAKLIGRGVVGATSNPTIFQGAIAEGNAYDDQIRELVEAGTSEPKELFLALARDDIRDACDAFRPVWDSTNKLDGWVSLEVDPNFAHDTQATADEAKRLHDLVDKPNLLVKIPATLEGLPAIEDSIAAGIPINVTLIFSLERHRAVAGAYIRGLKRLVENGGDPSTIASVASFFVSRVDTEADKRLEQVGGHDELNGTLAIANAKLAYVTYDEVFSGSEWEALEAKGATKQRCLWASTSTKNPAYRDVIYVEELIGPETVNTMPLQTVDGFDDHGELRGDTLTEDVEGAREILRKFGDAGIDYDDVVDTLEREGVEKFAKSFRELFSDLESKRDSLVAA
jgi:transaldolase